MKKIISLLLIGVSVLAINTTVFASRNEWRGYCNGDEYNACTIEDCPQTGYYQNEDGYYYGCIWNNGRDLENNATSNAQSTDYRVGGNMNYERGSRRGCCR